MHEDPFCLQLGIQPYECFVRAWMWTESLTQADTSPTSGFIALVDGALCGAFCHFKAVLGTWGYQEGDLVTYIAVCECSMMITTLWDLRDRVRGKAHLWLLDNSASLHARIRGTSSTSIWAEQWSCLTCFVTGLSLMSGLSSLIAALTIQTDQPRVARGPFLSTARISA